jgi:hypothetical protein
MLRFAACVFATTIIATSALAAPKLVITEIMYDPTSPESDDQQTEWVELQNCGDASVDLQGMQITSGSKTKPHDPKQRYVLRSGTIAPGAYFVIGIGSQSAYANFNLPTMQAYCDESHFAWFVNAGDSVAIRDAKGKVIDEVVFSSDSPWPAVRAGSSIQFVAPPGADPQEANDDGKNWIASGATNSDNYQGHGRGTPGGPPKSGAATQPSHARVPAPSTRPTARR